MSKAGINRNLPNDAYEAATNANNPSASNPFITEVESAVGSASLLLYPTSAASAIPTYSKLVNTISDPDYDDPAVDSSTGVINATGQLIAEFASEEGIISGNPGIVNVNTIGNIRRVSGTGTASFYFEIYHRNNLGTETLIGTSNNTGAASNAVYEQYFASCLINATNFGPTDRVVTKWYANRLPGGSDPTYEIQLGGATPVKITFPVPFVNLPSTVEELNDLTDVTTGLPGSPTNADDGRVLYFDVNTNQWISDDIANISNVVKDCKTSVGTGSIPKGTPVYLAGYDNDLLVVEACDAANAAEMPCIGITAEALDSTNAKKVVSFGKIQGVNTAAFTEGDILYVAAGGGFTTTRPTGTSLIQRIAVVLKADNPGGILKVINTSRTAGLPNITELYDWVGDSNGHPVERRNQVEPFLTGSAPTVTDDETLGYRKGSVVFDFSQVPNRLWMCLDASTGAAVWKTINNDILNIFRNVTTQADSGYTWGSSAIAASGINDTIDFVAGTNVTIETDPVQKAVKISTTGGGGGGASWEVEQYAYNMVPSGSANPWNGTSVAGAGTGTLDNVFYFRSFSGVGGADGTYFNIVIPDDYTPGADIKVSLKTTINGSGGDYKFFVGFRKRETTFNRFPSDDSTTEWQSAAIAGQINWPMQTLDFVFSGTGVLPLDAVAILIYRDPSDVGDTISDTAYVNSAIVREN